MIDLTRIGANGDPQDWWLGANQAADMGFKTARISALWYDNPESLRGLVDHIRRNDMRPLLPLGGNVAPSDASAYAEKCAQWAKVFPAAIYQLWNEPNHPMFGSLNPDYMALLAQQGYWAIKEAAPEAKIIGPSISPVGPTWQQYQERVYGQLRGDIGVACHIYPYSVNNPLTVVEENFKTASRFGKKVSVTEIGFIKSVYEDRQPELSAQAIGLLRKLGAKDVIFHRLRTALDPSEWEQHAKLGILDHRLLRKAIREAI